MNVKIYHQYYKNYLHNDEQSIHSNIDNFWVHVKSKKKQIVLSLTMIFNNKIVSNWYEIVNVLADNFALVFNICSNQLMINLNEESINDQLSVYYTVYSLL